jgi:hypothetical protein
VVTVILVVFIGSVILVLPVGYVIHVGGIVREGNSSRARWIAQGTGRKIGELVRRLVGRIVWRTVRWRIGNGKV